MFAIVKTGGKQYTVAENDVIVVEKLAGEAGSEIKLEDVLLVGAEGKTTVGTPLVKGASVTAEVLEQGKGDKVVIFKKKRRQNYRRTKGHRQEQTVLRIKSIKG
ncbi:50S ribosomal protein L21 [Terasakiella sp. SH-1]|uniref:50S ribosomal protein L21 n=1 Tax=Terasakiella sp. SH-1 TaxID=2560057 RepID=UPI001072ED53|nr:50S ribosomal protein L21 [Terasakiella sp. SH-1]